MSAFGGAPAPRWKRVCVFEDGENLSHSLADLFQVGSNRYDPVSRSLGTEKGVDTQLATDMVTLSDIYDVAVVVSGDADYMPPVSAVKNLGKLVYSVSFLTANGKKLPGGAWRLERRVDSQIEVSFERAQELLGIEEVAA